MIVPELSTPDPLDDGFGCYEKCDDPDCALELVRPGKVQCENCERKDDDDN